MTPIRLALCCDYLEERWPSMDLTGEMIARNLARHHAAAVTVTRVRPPFHARVTRVPRVGGRPVALNVDRMLNRMGDYPWHVWRLARRGELDLFHLVDHSYSQLVHAMPAGRAVVTCHDLDTFRCVLEPQAEPRPRWFRAMTQRILDGMTRAAAVACVSVRTRDQILAYGLVPEARLHVVNMAIDEALTPAPDAWADGEVTRVLGPPRPGGLPDLLHVGSTIPRKRIDVLLRTFAAVRTARPEARLIKLGGAFTPEQAALVETLGVADGIATFPFFSSEDPRHRALLAAVYRRGALLLQPSDAEGFGLPVVEAMACGTPVLASDLDVLREIGAGAASYAHPGDVASWTAATLALLDERANRPEAWARRRDAGLLHTRAFRWETHVDRLMGIYREVLERAPR